MKIPANLFATGAVIALLTGVQTAHAQSNATAADEQDNSSLAEIIVTAQKRSESLQKAPVAITAVSNEQLVARGINDIRAIANLVPSARFNVENNATQVFIRGVGSSLDVPVIAEGVGIQYNGVYIPRFATSAGLFDVERVEVLPGPQGTLYGRAAIGGIVNITGRRPDFNPGMNALVEVGNYNGVHFSGAVNMPLSDTVAVRGAIDFEHHDGYFSNGSDNKNSVGGRLSLLAKPNDALTIYLWGQYYQNRNRTATLVYVPSTGNPRKIPAVDQRPESLFYFYAPNGLSTTDNMFNHFYTYQFGGQIDLDLGGVSVSYTPGYVKHAEKSYKDIVGFVQQTDVSGEHFSNELRFSNSDPGKLNWLFALYQYHNTQPYAYTFGPAVGQNFPWLAGNDYTSKDDVYATYGQLTYSLTDAFRLTLGGRYSWERLKMNNGIAIFPNIVGPNPADFLRGVINFSYRNSWKRFDWKVSAEADVGPQSLVYANVQTGFNPGTFQSGPTFPGGPNAGDPLKPQKMLGFTAGTKNRFADNKIQANLELFYYRYTDQLVQQYNGTFINYNAPRTRMYGAELETVWAVSSNTRVNMKASYLNAKIGTFVSPAGDLSGFTLPFSPKWTVLGGFEQAFPLDSGDEIKLRVDSTYNSGYWDDFAHFASLRQESFTKTDINLTYSTAGDQLEFGLWVRNLENRNVHAAAAEVGSANPNITGAVFLEAPRTYGGRMVAKF